MNRKAKIIFTDKPPQQINWAVAPSFCGAIVIGLDEESRIRCISFAREKPVHQIIRKWRKTWAKTTFKANSREAKKVAQSIITTCFKNKTTAINCALKATPFQKRVWQELLKIPKGKTATYGEIASRIHHSKSARAVGLACGANPLPLIIPCHRVVAQNNLGGFNSGLNIKKKLLDKEHKKQKPH